MDKKGLLLGQVHKIKVICQRGQGAPVQQVDGSQEFVMVLETVSAKGKTIPPCVFWKEKHQLVGRYIPGIGEANARFACSPNG